MTWADGTFVGKKFPEAFQHPRVRAGNTGRVGLKESCRMFWKAPWRHQQICEYKDQVREERTLTNLLTNRRTGGNTKTYKIKVKEVVKEHIQRQ